MSELPQSGSDGLVLEFAPRSDSAVYSCCFLFQTAMMQTMPYDKVKDCTVCLEYAQQQPWGFMKVC